MLFDKEYEVKSTVARSQRWSGRMGSPSLLTIALCIPDGLTPDRLYL